MKWYKHISTSLDDPDIQAAMDLFRSDGYIGFFGILEIIAKETDDSFIPVTLKFNYCCRKVRLRADRLRKILKFYEDRKRFTISYNKDEISIFCPKLKQLSDDWTLKKLRQKTPELPGLLRSESGANPDTETDTRDKKQEIIKENRVVEIVEKSLKDKKGLVLKDEHKIFIHKLLEMYDPELIKVAWVYVFLNDANQERYGYTPKAFYGRIDALIPDAKRIMRNTQRTKESRTGPVSIKDILK